MDAATNPKFSNSLLILVRVLLWALIAELLVASSVYGLRLRHWTWNITEPIRFESDIQRGCAWGLEASGPEGYLNQYEKMDFEQPQTDPWLDYAPLRLFVMSRWGAWLWQHHPPGANDSPWSAWQTQYDYTAPVLRFNTALDAFAAICGFFLTWLWVRRAVDPDRRTHFRGIWQGLAAALLIWFSPAILLSSHGWPTWDSWIIPFFLLAALLASLDCWACAGIALAVGAMFKGQMLLMTPVFLVWPLMQKKWEKTLRFAIAMTLIFAAIASPWLLSYLQPDKLAAARQAQQDMNVQDYPPNLFQIPRFIDWSAIAWLALMLAAIVAAPIVTARFASRSKWHRLSASAGLFLAAVWPWFLARNRAQWPIGIAAAAALAAAAILIPRKKQPLVLAAVLGAGLLMCMDLFRGSTAWWDCGFHFGTIHWPVMIMGLTDNLPGIFSRRFGWSNNVNDVAFTLPAVKHLWQDTDITSKMLFNSIFFVMLALSALGVGLQARRKDPRILVALVTPWLVFFTFPVQIHERYLLFAAGVSAICSGQSLGAALLGVFLTAVTWIMTMNVMLAHGDTSSFGDSLAQQFPRLFSESSGDTLARLVDGTHPDLGWAVLLATLVFLWISLTPSRRRKTKIATLPPAPPAQ